MGQRAVRADVPMSFMPTEPACASAGLAKVGSEGLLVHAATAVRVRLLGSSGL